jgi:hypothetical protein
MQGKQSVSFSFKHLLIAPFILVWLNDGDYLNHLSTVTCCIAAHWDFLLFGNKMNWLEICWRERSLTPSVSSLSWSIVWIFRQLCEKTCKLLDFSNQFNNDQLKSQCYLTKLLFKWIVILLIEKKAAISKLLFCMQGKQSVSFSFKHLLIAPFILV